MLIILVAHHGEGKVFIEHYAMSLDSNDRSGRRFLGDGIALQIVGQGASDLTKSLVSVIRLIPAVPAVRWLNFGVAGSACHPVGNVVEVTAIGNGDVQNAEEFALQPLELAETACSLSFTEPQSCYPGKGVVDMEAWPIARFLASQSQLAKLSAIKLVVDAPGAEFQTLTRASLQRLLTDARTTITAISDKLLDTI